MKNLFLLLVLLVILAGCGRKGALVPPEALRPAPVTDLRVDQRGERLVVSWSRPKRTEGGRPLRKLDGFRLLRREILPPGQDCEDCPSAYRVISEIDLEFPLGVVVAGDRFFFYDAGLPEGKRYRYKLFARQKDGSSSPPSNRADRTKVVAPPAPVVTAQSAPTGISLQWAAVETPANGEIEGYSVYRQRGDEPFPPLPMTVGPQTAMTYTDTGLERNGRYRYAVSTIAVVQGEAVESELSKEVEGTLTEPE